MEDIKNEKITTLMLLLTLLNDSMEVLAKVAEGEGAEPEIIGRARFLITQFKEDYSGVAEAALPRIED